MNRGFAYSIVSLIAMLAVAVSLSLFSERAAGEKASLAQTDEATVVSFGERDGEIASVEAAAAVPMPSFKRKAGEDPPAVGTLRVLVADVRSGDVFYAARENER